MEEQDMHVKEFWHWRNPDEPVKGGQRLYEVVVRYWRNPDEPVKEDRFGPLPSGRDLDQMEREMRLAKERGRDDIAFVRVVRAGEPVE